MKPDVVGIRGSKVEWILDTKWKQLSIDDAKEGVSQADLYQMYAYASCYDCSDVVLLYPYHKELGGNAGVSGHYLLNPWLADVNGEKFKRVRIATIDLADLRTVTRQLKEILVIEEVDDKSVALG